MAYQCHKCGATLENDLAASAGRRSECPACQSDLHCCLNCRFHDAGIYNECRESQADRVLTKDRSNYCDYFSFGEGRATGAANGKDQTLKKLDDLFK